MLGHCVAPMSGNEKNARAPIRACTITEDAIDLRLEWSMIIIGHASLERAIITDEAMRAARTCVTLASPPGVLDHRSLAVLACERRGFEHVSAANARRIKPARRSDVLGQPGRRAVVNQQISLTLWQMRHSIGLIVALLAHGREER